MAYVWVVVLQLIGSMAIIAEVMVPSFGVLTISAIAAFGFSYYHLWAEKPEMIPILVVINLFSIPITLLLAVMGLGKSKLSLSEELDSDAIPDSPFSVGDTGVATTDLRPAGKITIEGILIDVLSTGDYIERGDQVQIKKINNTGIHVIKIGL